MDGPYHAMKGAVIGRFRFHAAMEEGGIYFPERGKTALAFLHTIYLGPPLTLETF